MVKLSSELLKALNSGGFGNSAQSNLRKSDLVPPRLRQRQRRESDDSAIARPKRRICFLSRFDLGQISSFRQVFLATYVLCPLGVQLSAGALRRGLGRMIQLLSAPNERQLLELQC